MKSSYVGKNLVELVFSWSIEDVLNRDFYKDKVKKIPKTFLSTSHYMNSFIFPLIEETHADLSSAIKTVSGQATREIRSIEIAKDYKPPDYLLYNVQLYIPEDIQNDQEIYVPETGDLIALTNVTPKCIDELDRPKGSYNIALVKRVSRELRNESYSELQILSSKPIVLEHFMEKNGRSESNFVVFLMNMTTNIRIWKALNSELGSGNLSIIEKVLLADPTVCQNCPLCFSKERYSIDVSTLGATIRSFDLNDSQEEAVLSCLAARECHHQNSIKLIWGPPGTGKTKTVASLLFTLLRRKCRTLTCAPTNIAVLEVTKRLLTLAMGSFEFDTYGLGDIVLFGNGERMKIDDHDDLLDVFLDFRAHILAQCFAPLSGWEYCLDLTICLLEDPEQQYHEYLEMGKKLDKEDENDEDEEQDWDNWIPGNENFQSNQGHGEIYARSIKNRKSIWKKVITQTLKGNKSMKKQKEKPDTLMRNQMKIEKKEGQNEGFTFKEFVMKEFNFVRKRMKFCIINMCTHLPTSFLSLRVVKKMMKTIELLESLGTSLCKLRLTNHLSEEVFSELSYEGNRFNGTSEQSKLNTARKECLEILRSLRDTFTSPKPVDEYAFKSFCLKHARLLFCTASSSAKLHIEGFPRVEMLVIDEAAQLKECESTIPLQLPCLRHVVLIGDERQLPAMVKSKFPTFGENMVIIDF